MRSAMEAQTPPTPTFFFPYRPVSGVPVLFARMARYFAESLGVPVRVVDYPDGYQAKTLAGVSGVELVPFADGQPLLIDDDAVLIMQGILPATIRPELQPAAGTRLLFWTLHPLNWIQTLLPFAKARDWQVRHPGWDHLVSTIVLPGHLRDMRQFLHGLDDAAALYFMDGTTLESTSKRLGTEFASPRMLPVAVETKGTRRRFVWEGRADAVRVGWVGRLADFKMPTLLHLIERLAAYARTGRDVELHVIGEGPAESDLIAAFAAHRELRAVHVGRLSGAGLDSYLLTHVDLLAAMGTSALEGARLGIPTLLLDIAYGSLIGDHPFRWLHDAQNFTLGEIIPERRRTTSDQSLERILDTIQARYVDASDATYAFCASQHDLARVATSLRGAIEQTTYRWADIPRAVSRKTFVRRAYEAGRTLRNGTSRMAVTAR